MKKLIQRLTETFSPSGYEASIRDVIRAEVKPYADEIRVDALGSLIVRKGRKAPRGSRIMIAAHMDEIGLIVTHVEENGLVRFSSIGFVFPQTIVGGRVRFAGGTPGIIGLEHPDRPDAMPALDKAFIDVGATSRADCPVKLGDVAAFDRPFLEMGRRLVAKSMDDRIGCAVAIAALQALQGGKSSPHEIYFVFTVQEEVGARGAGPAAFGLAPDLALAVDVTPTGDTPLGWRTDLGLGRGPAIKIRDSGMLADPRVIDWMEGTARKAKIAVQREVLTGGSSDASAIQVVRDGVPSGALSIPCRYVHSPSEMVDFDDVQASVRLLTALLKGPIAL